MISEHLSVEGGTALCEMENLVLGFLHFGRSRDDDVHFKQIGEIWSI